MRKEDQDLTPFAFATIVTAVHSFAFVFGVWVLDPLLKPFLN